MYCIKKLEEDEQEETYVLLKDCPINPTQSTYFTGFLPK